MGCGNCGTKNENGQPAGCKNNGNCSSGGCNRLNSFNWLSEIPLADYEQAFPFVELSFNNGSRKDFFKISKNISLNKGQYVAVEGFSGFDVGMVSLTGELVQWQMKKHRVKTNDKEIKQVLRYASDSDLELMERNKAKEKEVRLKARTLITDLKLNMKLSAVEIQADGKKATYYYTADDRVDFRELIKVLSAEFKMRVEMKQIGLRQEAAKVGGIGSCGRELCCSTWLTQFNSVSTAAARYQNLSINQTKLSGQCGRLKCCLNFELDTYMDALRVFPKRADKLKTKNGNIILQKRDIFNNLLWYSYPGSSKLYPLTIERVQEILALNAKGVEVDDIKPVEIAVKEGKEEQLEFADVVGHIQLKSLGRSKNKNKKNKPRNKKSPNTQNTEQRKNNKK